MTDKEKAVSLHLKSVGLVAQLDRVPDYGSGGCGFDSRPVHKKEIEKSVSFFRFIHQIARNTFSLSQRRKEIQSLSNLATQKTPQE